MGIKTNVAVGACVLLSGCAGLDHRLVQPQAADVAVPATQSSVPKTSETQPSKGDKPALAMWVWGGFATAEDREKLLAFCSAEDISHIDAHIGIKRRADGHIVHNAEALQALVTAAAARGITVNALRGDARMFFARNHERTFSDVEAIIDFDRQLPGGVHLAGLKFDVEPYGTEEWRAGGGQREKVMLDYLAFLEKAKALLEERAPHLELAVDVPMWWDTPKFAVTCGGETKPLVQHVQDRTDYIGIMSYRPSAKAVLQVSEHELAYAASIGKTACPGVETLAIKGAEKWITFWWKPVPEFRAAVRELQATLAEHSAARYIMLHHYGSLIKYLRAVPEEQTAAPQ